MSLISWLNSSVNNFGWVDIKLVKWSTAGFILMVAKLWPPLLSLEWYWYLLIAVLAAIRPVYKAFGRQKTIIV